MVEQLLGSQARFEAYQAMESGKRNERREAQLGDLTAGLYHEGVVRGVVVGLGESGELGADITVIGLANDREAVKSVLDGAGFPAEQAQSKGLNRLSVQTDGVNVSYDVVLGEQSPSDAKVIVMQIGEQQVQLRVSEETVNLGGHEVPKIYAVNPAEIQMAYMKALETGNIAELSRLEKLLTVEERKEYEVQYKAQKLAETAREGKSPVDERAIPGSVEDLAKARLMDDAELEELQRQDSEQELWEETSFEYTIDDLEGEIIRAQQYALETWESDEDLKSQDQTTAEELYNRFYADDKFIAGLDGKTARNVILAAIPQIKGQFTREDLMVLMEQLVIQNMHRTMVNRGAEGPERSIDLLVRKQRFESANATGANVGGTQAN